MHLAPRPRAWTVRIFWVSRVAQRSKLMRASQFCVARTQPISALSTATADTLHLNAEGASIGGLLHLLGAELKLKVDLDRNAG